MDAGHAGRPDRWSKDGLDLADDRAALGWLEAERANVLAAVEQAAATPAVPAEIAIQLAQALFGFPWVRCHWDDLAQVNRTAMRVARRIGDEGLLREAKQRRSQEATHPP